MWIAYFIGCFLAYWIVTRHMIISDAFVESDFRGSWKMIGITMLIQLGGALLSWLIVILEASYELPNWWRWIKNIIKVTYVNIKLTYKFWWIRFFNIPL